MRITFMSAAVYLAALVAPFQTSAHETPAAQQGALPDGPGKAVVEKVCTTCHGAEYIVAERGVAAWRETIELMKAYGAVATDEEWATVNTYILSRLASLSVNRAAARDFADVFLVTDEVAAGVVAHRDKTGGFKSIDDLKKAPGLDASAIDAAKDRLIFDAN